MIDLHVHSTRSDGTYTPTQLVDYAMEKGLAAFALTDHDTIDGLDEAVTYAQRLNAAALAQEGRKSSVSNHVNQTPVPEVIPGIEFSTEHQGHDVHILGLYIDHHDPDFQRQLGAFVDSRTARNRKMCRLLTEAGFSVTYEALLAEFPDAVITRAHYAKYLLNHGFVNSMSEAFERYIGDGCPCFVPREKVTPIQAVRLVREAGGVPILAHPVLYHMDDGQLDALVLRLKEAGLIGLEAIYSTYNDVDERRMRTLAKKYGLLVSGGSDFHGSNKPGLDLGTGYGRLFVPRSILDDIKRAAHLHISG